MKNSKKLLTVIATTFILGIVIVYGVSSVSADEPYRPIVTKLAERFNLNEADVQQVFDEQRAEQYANMMDRFIERLDEAVANGDITPEQKQAILDKHEEMHAKRLDLEGLTPEERKAEMDSWHEELKVWAEENNIDLSLLMPGPGGHHGMGRHGGPFGEE